jgi:hypothetical protein
MSSMGQRLYVCSVCSEGGAAAHDSCLLQTASRQPQQITIVNCRNLCGAVGLLKSFWPTIKMSIHVIAPRCSLCYRMACDRNSMARYTFTSDQNGIMSIQAKCISAIANVLLINSADQPVVRHCGVMTTGHCTGDRLRRRAITSKTCPDTSAVVLVHAWSAAGDNCGGWLWRRFTVRCDAFPLTRFVATVDQHKSAKLLIINVP